jgi:hypothetical protein
VTNQPAGPANTSDILYFMRVLLFVTLLSMGYALSRPQTASGAALDKLADNTGTGQDREWQGLPPWQREASKKAIGRYAASQDKKWRRWNEAMFERYD